MIKIVTDSTAYLPAETVAEHDIRVVPLNVHFGTEAFKEGVHLSNEEFYRRLKEAPELPTTSQPSAGEFLEVYEPLVKAGHEVLTLTISSKLSGTWNSAMAAKEMMPDAPITVIDSLSTSVGLHLMIDAALKAAAAGATVQEIVDQIEPIRHKMRIFLLVDTLEYLAKGGRIGNGKAFLGTLLNVKPILVLQEGALEPLEQVRSKRKAKARMVEIVEEYVDAQGSEARLAVTNALLRDEAELLGQELVGCLGCAQPLVADLGPVIGTHTGPGCLGIAAYV